MPTRVEWNISGGLLRDDFFFIFLVSERIAARVRISSTNTARVCFPLQYAAVNIHPGFVYGPRAIESFLFDLWSTFRRRATSG